MSSSESLLSGTSATTVTNLVNIFDAPKCHTGATQIVLTYPVILARSRVLIDIASTLNHCPNVSHRITSKIHHSASMSSLNQDARFGAHVLGDARHTPG